MIWGIQEAANRILDGTYVCPLGVDQYTRDFIVSLQVTSLIRPEKRIECSMTKEDYIAYWKRFRERTSPSILGLHVSHWKAAAESKYLAETHEMLTEMVVSTGYSPTRWQQGLSVMLEKEEGCRDLERLR